MKRVMVFGATLALLIAPVLVRLLKAQAPSAPPPPPPTYTLTDLGPMTVGGIDQLNVRTGPTALNANAQVAGFRFNLAFGDQPIGFLWDKGTFTDLGTGGGPQSYAYGINDAGQIVGTSNFVPSSSFPGDLTGNSSRAFIYQNGAMTILDADPNNWSRAYAINKGGDAAGFISPGGVLPVIWKAGAGRTMLTSLPCSLAACQGEALAINDLGQAAGVSVGGTVNAFRPVMWDSNGQPTDLIPEPGDPGTSEANGINNNGVVIGYYQPQPSINNFLHAFRWQSGAFTDLGTLGTDTYSGAWGIDSNGDIVGTSATTFSPILGSDGGRAFLYIAATQTMYDLTDLVPGTNWRLNAGYAINDNGQIVGIGIAPDGSVHGFLLTPIITPTTTALTTSGTPSVFGQSVSFAATVTPTPPNANAANDIVTFFDGNTSLGTGTYGGNGVWIFNTALSVGNHSITASYIGDNNFGASTSTALSQTVSQAGTVTGLTASSNTANVGQAVMFTATVTVAAPGGGTPTGTVTFSANGLALTCTAGTQTVSAGQATCQYAFATAGAESITASYNGDTNFTGSASSAMTVTVPAAPPPVVQVAVNENVTVTDTETLSDVFDPENVKVTDAAWVTPLIQVSAPVAEFSAGTLGFNGQSGSQTITVSDIGTGSLTVSSAGISGSSQFAITQIACSNNSSSASTTLPSGGACVLTIGYSASTTPANDIATLVFTDNSALSNVTSVSVGSSYTQTIPLSGSGTTTAPPPPPPAVIPIPVNETIHVMDTESFPDVFDSEAVHVADAVFVTPLIQVSAPVAEFSAGTLGFNGQSGSQTVTVSDIGTGPLIVASASISGSPQFSVTQVGCSNSATSASTTLLSGGVCLLTIGYSASATPAADTATLVFSDNAALSNVTSVPVGSSYTQSIPLSGGGSTTPPPPPPPAVVPLMDNETIHVMDTESFPDVFDAEKITVTDQVSVQALNATTTSINITGAAVYGTPASAMVSVSSSTAAATGNVALSVDGGTPSTLSLINGSATFNLGNLSVGSHALAANFPAQGNFLGSSAATKFVVTQATPTIIWKNPSPITYGAQLTGAQLNALASVTGSFVYSPAAGTVLTAGTQTLSVTFTPTDTTDYTTATATVTLLVNPATPTITWANPVPITYGTPISTTQLNATASVKGMFTYNVALGTVLGAGSQTLSAKFSPADTTDYTPAVATVTLLVNQATPTITWVNPPAITYGTALSGKQLNAIASVPGAFTYSPDAGTILTAGSQTLSAVFTPTDTIDYTRAKASVTLVVNQATPIITWANPAPITQGTPLSSAQLNATASVSGVSLPGTFAYNPPLKTVLGAGTQTLSVTFTPTDTTDYQTVTASVSITVNVNGNLSIQPGQTYTFNNGSISGNVTLKGGTLTLIGSTVGGSLTMSSGNLTLGGNSTVSNNLQIQGGTFSIGQASIKGNLQITNVPAGKTPGVVCGASVSGDLQFQYNAIPGQIGPSSCSGNRIGGNLMISNNTASLQVFKNSVGGNLQVQSNSGSAQIFQNTVQNLLQCSGNSSPFTGGQNTAAGKQGQCANF